MEQCEMVKLLTGGILCGVLTIGLFIWASVVDSIKFALSFIGIIYGAYIIAALLIFGIHELSKYLLC